jgi:hypothetical protein
MTVLEPHPRNNPQVAGEIRVKENTYNSHEYNGTDLVLVHQIWLHFLIAFLYLYRPIT